MLYRKLLLTALLLGSLLPLGASANPVVVTTIKPLQFIAQAILDGEGTATALIGESDSPHHFNLSPNDRIGIERADLLLWIDPSFEIYLAPLFEELSTEQSKSLITSAEIEGMTLHRFPTGELDPHLWLSQENATLIGAALTDQLATLYPDKASHYRAAHDRFRRANDALARELEAQFSGPHSTNYLVYHDAYRYLEHDLGLAHSARLVEDPDVQPGMREVLAVREVVKATNPACVLMEPDSSPALVNTVVQGADVKQIVIDLLGNEIMPSHDAYQQLLKHVASGLTSCLNLEMSD